MHLPYRDSLFSLRRLMIRNFVTQAKRYFGGAAYRTLQIVKHISWHRVSLERGSYPDRLPGIQSLPQSSSVFCTVLDLQSNGFVSVRAPGNPGSGSAAGPARPTTTVRSFNCLRFTQLSRVSTTRARGAGQYGESHHPRQSFADRAQCWPVQSPGPVVQAG